MEIPRLSLSLDAFPLVTPHRQQNERDGGAAGGCWRWWWRWPDFVKITAQHKSRARNPGISLLLLITSFFSRGYAHYARPLSPSS